MNTEITFHPQVQAALDFIGKVDHPSIHDENPVIAARNFYLQLVSLGGEQSEHVQQVENRVIDTPEGRIPVRIYRPSNEPSLPVAVYFHGGWFYVGDLDTHDRTVRALANAANCVVVAVDYALAPEHPFPAGLKQCYAAVQWVFDYAEALGVDPNRIALVGDSAGANLATVVAKLLTRNNGPKILFQGLVYPATDWSFDAASWKEFADGPILTLGEAEFVKAIVVPDPAQAIHPDASPLLEKDLSGLPPALVIIAEYDPLRDEGIAYAQALTAAGVPVTETVYKGMIHGFFQMGGMIEDGKKAIEEMASHLRHHFNAQSNN